VLTALTVLVFGIAWWLGLYLLARDPAKPTLRRAGAGLLSYALALAVDAPGPVHAVLLSLPAVLWTGVLVRLLPERGDAWWRFGALPVTVLAAAVAGYAGGVALAVLGVVVLVPLGWMVALVIRRAAPGRLAMALLMLGLAGGLLLAGLDVPPRPLWLGGIGVDLVALGLCVAVLDSLDEGETLRRDMLGSLLVAGATAVLFGGQVALAILLAGERPGLRLLLYGVVAAAIAVQVLARPIQSAADRIALPPQLRRTRTELRAVAAALPRRDETVALAALPEAEFSRLTRRALSHYGDLGKLVASPLTALPAIGERLAARGAPDAPLERATELKALLLDTITRLKPRDGEFGTSEEWRHYNALYFYYVAGIRPYSVRTKLTEPDPTARRALAWFADHVPERTLHNWQAAAARVVAADLRAGLVAETG
jgi:hypothetical protein